MIIAWPTFGAALAADLNTAQLKTQFLQLCDVAADQLRASQPTKRQFYIDSYAVRALAAAYDLTGEEKYLAACKAWSDRMVSFQEKMIPRNAYYMNYHRKPGETNRAWYVADSSCIAMGVLATSVRATNAMEKSRYLDSAKGFGDLVLENYLSASGGVRNGMWPKYDGEWWCSSGTFGALAFLLYDETGERRYLDAGLKVVTWLSQQELGSTGPMPLKESGPALPMYYFEAFSAGLPQIGKQSAIDGLARKQIDAFFQWTAINLCGKGDSAGFPFDSQWGSKFGGIPFHAYVLARKNSPEGMRTMADGELQEVISHVFAGGKPEFSQVAAFAMISCAERLSPGALYRSTNLSQKVASRK